MPRNRLAGIPCDRRLLIPASDMRASHLQETERFVMDAVELVARALCRQYNRGFEDGTDDNPYGGADSGQDQEKYLDGLVDENWREWITEAETLLSSLASSQKR